MKELSDRDIEKVRAEFDYFDEDSSGELSLEEFRRLFNIIAPDARRAEADTGFSEIDEDQSGGIEFDEFLDWWKSNWLVY